MCDSAPCEPPDEVEESHSGDDEVAFDDLNLDMEGLNLNMDDCSSAVRVRTLHISSLILAAKSPFFYKLFSNDMRELEQRHVTLRIFESAIL